MKKGIKVLLSLAAILCAGGMIIAGLGGADRQSVSSNTCVETVQNEKENDTDKEETVELEKVELPLYENTLQPDTSSGSYVPGEIVESNGSLYYTCGDAGVTAVDLDGTNKRTIVDVIDDKTGYLMITDQYIYVRCDGYTVRQYSFDGELMGQVGEVLNWGYVCHWYFQDGCLYFQGMSSDNEIYSGLYRVAVGSGDYPECVTKNCKSNSDTDVYFYEDKIYFFDNDISFCSIRDDGTEEKVLRKNNVEPDNEITLHGAETQWLTLGLYAQDGLYYAVDGEDTYRRLNVQTAEEEVLPWQYIQDARLGALIEGDYISYWAQEDYVRYIKSYQISTGEERSLKEFVEHLPNNLVERVPCYLVEVPGATRIYYVVELEGEKAFYSITADGSEERKLDALEETIPHISAGYGDF